MCLWRNSSYEFESFAPSILHRLAVFELPIHLLSAYVVLYKTPSRMGSVKWMMFTMHICGAYLDLFLSALSTQFFLLPAAAGHSQGVYTHLGMPVRWQAYMFISAICLAGVSILGFFENRYAALVKGRGASLIQEKQRLAYIGGHYIYAFIFILPITFTPPDQTYGKQYVKQMLPCLPQEIFDHPDFYVYAIEITLLTFIIGSAAFVITGEVIFYFTRIVVYLSSTKAKSQKTYKLQLHFFICLTIQITIPLLIVIVPIVYIVFAFANSHFDQILNNISLNIMAFHGLISSAVMLTIHKPYRKAVLKMLGFTYIKTKVNRSAVHMDGTFVVVSNNRF
ncbi:Serpentine Receptor, class H [Caenorhabditis elegans]|uniref:Serpentine Receptor, class H n=1 Tax=Caenorhabditis elegans TaxID=6239 RepID=Q9GUC3_CAEEL|nr:Serpentine Receptor, class H [Caenorhabditis elegans]CCD62729.1 Serpentine Receptor, class H [Caenorhabditis elegans]|eukprot:NP_504379.1 Serpentine Receptor, class H [Caenorhabditis elegans]